jgi:CBS domain-containing protein
LPRIREIAKIRLGQPNNAHLPGKRLSGNRRMDLARNLRIDSVSRLFPTPPHQLTPAALVADAVALMRREKVGCVLVCAEERLVGILTERDVMRRVIAADRPMTTPVAECMTPDPVTVSSKESIRFAIERMEQGSYRHLPVLDERQRLVGILSVKRIVHYLVEHFPGTVYCQPPDPRAVAPKREGA